MTQVDLFRLGLTYPGRAVAALEDLTLSVKSGSMTAILGPSGSGKSTLLKLIAGTIVPDRGDIQFDAGSILSLQPEQRGAVMVFQDHLLFPHLTVAGNVGFGLRMRGVARQQIDRAVRDMLDKVQMADFGPRRAASLSGGQQQRVALVRALIVQPKVLLLDEPLSSLDAYLRSEMRDLIIALQRETAVTTLLVTHDQQEAMIMADSVALMMAGRLVQHDLPDVVFQRPASIAAARFFGARTFVEGTVQAGRFVSSLGVLDLGASFSDGPGILTIRPEAVQLGQDAENTLAATLRSRQFMGTQTLLRLAVGPVELEALVPPDRAVGLEPGCAVQVHLPRPALWILPKGTLADG